MLGKLAQKDVKIDSSPSFLEFLKENSPAPHYLWSLLDYANVLLEAIRFHFEKLLEKDEELFNHYQICTFRGIESRLLSIQKDLERSQKRETGRFIKG